MSNLTVVYYTSNYLDKTNPFFLENTKKQLRRAIGDLPLIVVSHKPVKKFNDGEYTNIVTGDIGRSHLNIYRQILWGTQEAKTEYVAMAEDDILYSYEHFHSKQLEHDRRPDVFLYDMNKVSLFTWTNPPMFSFRTKRKVVNQLIAPTQYLIDAMTERFDRINDHVLAGGKEEDLLKFFGDPGRYEDKLGVTVRNTFESYCDNPSIVFSHPEAYGYLNQGSRKRLGDLKIIELYRWGRAEDIMKLWGEITKK